MKVKAIIVLVLVVFVVIFAIQNIATVDVLFLFWSFSVSRILLVIVLLLVGFFLGITYSNISILKGKEK